MKNVIKHIVLFILTSAGGFMVMSIPFRLLENLSQIEMRLVLVAEVAAAALILSVVFLVKESREQKAKRKASAKEMRWKEMLRQISDTGSCSENFDYAA